MGDRSNLSFVGKHGPQAQCCHHEACTHTLHIGILLFAFVEFLDNNFGLNHHVDQGPQLFLPFFVGDVLSRLRLHHFSSLHQRCFEPRCKRGILHHSFVQQAGQLLSTIRIVGRRRQFGDQRFHGIVGDDAVVVATTRVLHLICWPFVQLLMYWKNGESMCKKRYGQQ